MKTTTSNLRLLTICLALAALFAGTEVARAVRWTGEGNDTNWSNPANWGPKGEPPATYPQGGASAEIIDAVVDLDVNVQIENVTLAGSGNGGLIRGGGGNLTVTGTLAISNGELANGTDTPMTVNIKPPATLKWIGGSFRQHVGGVTINNAGTIEWSNGPVFFDGVLNNTGLFLIFGDHGFGSANRTGVINNTGRIIKRTGTGISQFSGFTAQTNSIDTVLNNKGAVLVASGTIEIGSGITGDTGKWEIGDKHFLLVSTPHLFDHGTTFEGTGTLLLKNSGTQFAGDIETSVTFELSNDFEFGGFGTGNGSTIDEATFHGPGRLVWGGDPRGSAIRGKLTLGPDFRTVTVGGGIKWSENLINRGTMTWGGGGPIGERGAFFRNEGTLNVVEAGTFLGYDSTFENAGTVNTFGGGASVSEAGVLRNDGVVNVGGFGKAGILRIHLPNGFTQTASGALYMEIGGPNAATPEFDQLTGSVTIDGGLSVEVINGYAPPKDARFALLDNVDTNAASKQFARVFTEGGAERFRVEYPDRRVELVSLSDAAISPRLWAAGRDLARNETPDREAELPATNERVPQWSYGYRSAAASTNLTLFTPKRHINDATGLHGWIAAGQATLAVNTKNSPIVFNTGSGNYKPLFPEQIYMAPGSGNEFLVVRWTAPKAGDYRIVGATWLDLDKHGGNGATAYLVRNGTTIFEEAFKATETSRGRARLRARTLSLNAGDTLDFVLGSNGEHLFDATAFNVAIARAPKVSIVSSAGAQNVTFDVDVGDAEPGANVTLTVDDAENVASDSTAPYSLKTRLAPGYHKVTAVVTDRRGVKVESEEVTLVVDPAAAGQARSASGDATRAAATTPGILRRSAKGGGAAWFDANTWSPNGIPTQFDYVIIQPGHAITIDGGAVVRDLAVEGSLSSVAGVVGQLDVYGTLYANGRIQDLEVFIQRSGKFLNLRNTAVLRFVELTNYGRLVVNANQFDGEGVKIENRGVFTASPPIGSEGPLQVNLTEFNQRGAVATTEVGSGTLIDIRRPAGTQTPPTFEGVVNFSPGYAIGENGAGFMGMNGGTLIGTDGATLIGTDGASIVGQKGASLIGTDGATLVGTDGATLIGTDGASLVGTAGGTLISDNGAAAPGFRSDRLVAAADAAASEATKESAIILAGGTVTGIGEIRGNVINQGAYMSPGSSAGAIVVNGNYTQKAGGTLVLELGGKNFATRFDVFQVAGKATLGGNLVVKTINNYTPASAESLSPLLYGSVNGTFTNVSSNAQIAYKAKKMSTTVSGPNPPAPKALNISTRMRVGTDDNVLIAGFIVTGDQPKKVLIRGLGPSLPVNGALADPTLDLDGGAVLNDDWQKDQEAAIKATGIPPSRDVEAAMVVTLNPGPHTAALRGKAGGTGVGLVEVYDLESGKPEQLANISTRGQVLTGDDVMIGGFIIDGIYPAKVLLRAIGSSLPVPGALKDPTLDLVDGQGNIISNDNWRATQEAEIAAVLPPNAEKEAAIIATLVPGPYTAIVRGKDGTTGIALVEGYNLR